MNEGPCLGGPRDGLWFKHEETSFDVFQALEDQKPGQKVRVKKIGAYVYQFGCWLWRAK